MRWKMSLKCQPFFSAIMYSQHLQFCNESMKALKRTLFWKESICKRRSCSARKNQVQNHPSLWTWSIVKIGPSFANVTTADLFWNVQSYNMMTSSNGNIFRVTGHLCGEFTGPGEFPKQRPVTRSFDVFFDLRLNKRLSKQPWGWWFETPSWSLWRQCNELI